MNTKKLSGRLFLVLFILLLASLACGREQNLTPAENEPAQAPSQPVQSETAQEGDILFQDDFQDGQPDRWEITAAWDIQQSGDMYTFATSGSGGAWVPEGSSWNNYAFETSARLDAGSLLLGFNLSQAGRYIVRLDEVGLYLIKENPAKNYTVVAQTGPISLSEWHQLDTRAYNGQIQVYVDDELWVDYTDNAPLTRGSIAVTAQDGSQGAVDNILVTKIGPLPEGVTVHAPPPLDVETDLDMGDDGIILEQIPEAENQGDPQENQTFSGLPDLIVVEATYDPDPVISGQPFVASYIIQNQGDSPSGAFTLLWKFHEATGVGVCSWDYAELGAGETVWGGCTKTTNAQPGQSPARLIVDFEGEINESDENNNELATTLQVITSAQDSGGEAESALPDLVVGTMGYVQRKFRCELVNYGNGVAPAGARVTAFANGNKLSWEETTEPLPSGASVIMYFPVDLDISEIETARCIADRGNSIAESNEDNNEFIWWPE